MLKVSPWKGVVWFGKKGKSAPRFVGPFEILERIGLVAYRLRLPEELSSVHDTFLVSNLLKVFANANSALRWNSQAVDQSLPLGNVRIHMERTKYPQLFENAIVET
ncbi:hypothetical protein Tco_0365806 [Tanacetum coccineum]